MLDYQACAQATTQQLLGLKDLLPGVNISSLVTRW